MNPIGFLVGAAFALVLIILATAVPTLWVLLSDRVAGRARFAWLLATAAPSVLYWSNVYGTGPAWLALAGVSLGPLVLVAFLISMRKRKNLEQGVGEP